MTVAIEDNRVIDDNSDLVEYEYCMELFKKSECLGTVDNEIICSDCFDYLNH